MLALALGGRSVAEWQQAMTKREFEDWKRYYMQAPFDDLHRYHRPAALVAHAAGQVDIGKAIDMLANDRTRVLPDEDMAGLDGVFSEADLRTFKALGVTPPQVH